MGSKIFSILIMFIIAVGSSNPQGIGQSDDAFRSLFKLGSTPFINKSKINTGLSYGLNYGSPSRMLQQWTLPDYEKKILFTDIKAYLSFGSKLEVYLKHTEEYFFAYNSSYLGEGSSSIRYDYGVKYKFIDSEGYVPDAALEINSEYPISLTTGSSDEALKYYVCIDFGFYYILLPHRYSAGVAYTLIDQLSLFAEGNYESEWDGATPTHSARTGIDISLYNFVHLDLALFYFDFRFRDIIPFRTGLTWQNPDYIMTMPEKNKYYLLSSSVTVNLDVLK
jgi:hypothetical protein